MDHTTKSKIEEAGRSRYGKSASVAKALTGAKPKGALTKAEVAFLKKHQGLWPQRGGVDLGPWARVVLYGDIVKYAKPTEMAAWIKLLRRGLIRIERKDVRPGSYSKSPSADWIYVAVLTPAGAEAAAGGQRGSRAAQQCRVKTGARKGQFAKCRKPARKGRKAVSFALPKSRGTTVTLRGPRGETATLRYRKPGSYTLTKGQHKRWGNAKEIREDIAHFHMGGTLPRSQAGWAAKGRKADLSDGAQFAKMLRKSWRGVKWSGTYGSADMGGLKIRWTESGSDDAVIVTIASHPYLKGSPENVMKALNEIRHAFRHGG